MFKWFCQVVICNGLSRIIIQLALCRLSSVKSLLIGLKCRSVLMIRSFLYVKVNLRKNNFVCRCCYQQKRMITSFFFNPGLHLSNSRRVPRLGKCFSPILFKRSLLVFVQSKPFWKGSNLPSEIPVAENNLSANKLCALKIVLWDMTEEIVFFLVLRNARHSLMNIDRVYLLYRDMGIQRYGHSPVLGIPIPKTLVIWASPCHITVAIWIRVTGDAHITRVLGMGMSISL